jgi:hypothetical protein
VFLSTSPHDARESAHPIIAGANWFSLVVAGLDPAIHRNRAILKTDARIKSARDDIAAGPHVDRHQKRRRDEVLNNRQQTAQDRSLT